MKFLKNILKETEFGFTKFYGTLTVEIATRYIFVAFKQIFTSSSQK